ncbi:MAG: hypothetical protein R2771_11815 [Saprospiraceae bacterium]
MSKEYVRLSEDFEPQLLQDSKTLYWFLFVTDSKVRFTLGYKNDGKSEYSF